MKEFKHLITSGCSFSDARTPYTWPLQLSSSYNISSYHTGLGSQGNGLIARKAIYAVHRALMQGISPKEILVGIMWSGPDRQDFYVSQPRVDVHDGYMQNPTTFTGSTPRWVIVNHNWRNQYAKNWYANLHDTVGAQIYTYEHVLRTQWFLKLHKVPYFMTTYTGRVFESQHQVHTEISWLHDQIDWSKFLPIEGEYEWCRDHSGIKFPVDGDPHPGTAQHEKFVEKVVLPFIDNGL